MKAPLYKIHGLDDDDDVRVEYPATSDVFHMAGQIHDCARRGLRSAVYVLKGIHGQKSST